MQLLVMYSTPAPASLGFIDPSKPSLVLKHYPKFWLALFQRDGMTNRFFIGLMYFPRFNNLPCFASVLKLQ
jgi:hypothetical protein